MSTGEPLPLHPDLVFDQFALVEDMDEVEAVFEMADVQADFFTSRDRPQQLLSSAVIQT